MPFPPPVLPINITDATEQQTLHSDLHNKTSAAVNDTVTKVTSVAADVANLQSANVIRPAGLIGYAERNTSAGPTGGATGIGGLAVTIVLTRQRMLKVEFYCRQLSTNPPDAGSIQIRDNGVIVVDGVYVTSTSGYAQALHIVKYWIAAAGTHTIEPWINAGAQLVTLNAQTYSPMSLAVTDYGDR